jgi:hypothetical protein
MLCRNSCSSCAVITSRTFLRGICTTRPSTEESRITWNTIEFGGYYCDGIGRTSPTDVCDAGFYCREKAYTSAPPDGLTGGLCPAGGYCPPGSATASSCVVGKYSASPGAKTEFEVMSFLYHHNNILQGTVCNLWLYVSW